MGVTFTLLDCLDMSKAKPNPSGRFSTRSWMMDVVAANTTDARSIVFLAVQMDAEYARNGSDPRACSCSASVYLLLPCLMLSGVLGSNDLETTSVLSPLNDP